MFYRRLIFGLIAVSAISITLMVSWTIARNNAKKIESVNTIPKPIDSLSTPASSVQVIEVVSQRLNRKIRLPAELQAYRQVAVYSKVQGFVEWIGVDRGTLVKRGQLIARLSAPELAAQRINVEAQLAGDDVTYKRLKTASLIPGVVAQNEVEVAKKKVEADSAQVQSTRDIESYLHITAPFNGVVTERNVHEGSLVGPSGGAASLPMLRIQEVSRLRLIIYIPEVDVAVITQGAKIDFTVPAFPGQTFSGTIQHIAHALDVKTRTMPVELDVDNTSGKLAPGMYSEVAWPTKRPEPSLFVPRSAVATTTERTFVIRIRDGIAEWVDVKRGTLLENLVEIFGEIKEGDMVAVRGTDELRPGTRVIVKHASSIR